MPFLKPFSSLDRRRFLRGAGASIALPAFASLLPSNRALAQSAPARIVYIYLPNGAQWQPQTTGYNFSLPLPLQDLGGLTDYLTVISGLTLGPAKSTIAGDHSRAQAAYMTGVTGAYPGPLVGKSIDVDLAAAIGRDTRVGSLCLTGEGYNGGESGYAPEYQTYLSWVGSQSPNSRDTDPAVVFDRLFGARTSFRSGANAPDPNKSVLDAVLEQAQTLQRNLSQADQNRLGEYLQGLRELEQRLATTTNETLANTCQPGQRPTSNGSYDQRISLFYDVLYHALACGQTRVASFLLAGESSNQNYEFAGVHGGHHEISHDSSPQGYAKLAQIVRWHVSQLGKLADRLRQTREGSGNMLDNSVLLLGGGLADGARHNHDNLPVLLLGKGGGFIRGHQHYNFNNMPFMNLQLTMAKAFGLSWNSFGDSNGTFELG